MCPYDHGAYSFIRHTFNPDRYLNDTLSCADSAKLSNVMERDHWAFGAGYVGNQS